MSERKSLFEREREWNEHLLKLYEEGALEVRLSIKAEWTNENMHKIVEVLRKGKIEHFKVSRAILHPTKDIGPEKHEKDIVVHFVTSPFKIDEVVNALHEIGKTDIDAIQSGALLFTTTRDVIFLLKEEEP